MFNRKPRPCRIPPRRVFKQILILRSVLCPVVVGLIVPGSSPVHDALAAAVSKTLVMQTNKTIKVAIKSKPKSFVAGESMTVKANKKGQVHG
jgi:hypothetical protein